MNKVLCQAKEGLKYEVIVIGGGPAGCAAAIASAREHKKTLLIEATGALGGMATMGLVPMWCPFSDQTQLVYRGIAEKIFLQAKACVPNESAERVDWVAINPEPLKRIYDDEVTGAGADVLFLTQVCDVVTDGSRVLGVVAANKAGLTVYRADVFVDATGDGDIAVRSGAGFDMGRNGAVQSVTHCFSMSNVDSYGYAYVLGGRMRTGDIPQQDLVCRALQQDPSLDMIHDLHFCNAMFAPGAVGFNAGHIEVNDVTDPMELSRILLTGRKLAHQFETGLKRHAPEAFGNAWLSLTAPLPGVRESRRILCDYTITVQDYLARRSFSDEIGRNNYYVDVHYSSKEANAEEVINYEHYGPGESHGIPYRSLLPKGLDNLLVAGRCIGSDDRVNGSIRIMPACLVTGEAAGLAAAMAAETGSTRSIDVSAMQNKLEAYGAYLHMK